MILLHAQSGSIQSPPGNYHVLCDRANFPELSTRKILNGVTLRIKLTKMRRRPRCAWKSFPRGIKRIFPLRSPTIVFPAMRSSTRISYAGSFSPKNCRLNSWNRGRSQFRSSALVRRTARVLINHNLTPLRAPLKGRRKGLEVVLRVPLL
jgi:hypothetical protein